MTAIHHATPSKFQTGFDDFEWGAAIQNPPSSLAEGDQVIVTTKSGEIRRAIVRYVQQRHSDYALVLLADEVTVLVQGTNPAGQEIEVTRDWQSRNIYFCDRKMGRLQQDGQVHLVDFGLGKALTKEVGSDTVPLGQLVGHICSAFTAIGGVLRIPQSEGAVTGPPE